MRGWGERGKRNCRIRQSDVQWSRQRVAHDVARVLLLLLHPPAPPSRSTHRPTPRAPTPPGRQTPSAATPRLCGARWGRLAKLRLPDLPSSVCHGSQPQISLQLNMLPTCARHSLPCSPHVPGTPPPPPPPLHVPHATLPPSHPASPPRSEYLEKNFAETSGRDTLKLALRALTEVGTLGSACRAKRCRSGRLRAPLTPRCVAGTPPQLCSAPPCLPLPPAGG